MQENIASTLLKTKLERKLSLTEFAAELGISRSSLQEYISGRGDLRLSTIELLALRLEIDPITLIWGEEPPAEGNQPLSVEALAEHLRQYTELSAEISKLLQAIIQMVEKGPAKRDCCDTYNEDE